MPHGMLSEMVSGTLCECTEHEAC